MMNLHENIQRIQSMMGLTEEIEETISESIDDIRKLKVIDKVLEKEYPNQHVDEHMGSTLVFTDKAINNLLNLFL